MFESEHKKHMLCNRMSVFLGKNWWTFQVISQKHVICYGYIERIFISAPV